MPYLDDRTVAITRFFVDVPPARRLVLYLLAFSALAGFALKLALLPLAQLRDLALGDALVYGVAEGMFLLFLPALVAAVLSASVLQPRALSRALKSHLLVALAATVVISAAYLAGVFLYRAAQFDVTVFLLVANALGLGVWLLASVAFLHAGARGLVTSFFHPVLSLSLLAVSRAYGLVEPPELLGLRFLAAALVFLVAFGAFAYVVNAPARRNFGVSALQAFSLVIAQWTAGSKGLENIVADMGERVVTRNDAVAFRRRDGRLKAAFLVPGVHFGPIGNLGGSEFPALLAAELEPRLRAPAFVFHSTCNHDFNPVYSSSVHALARALERLARGARGGADRASLASAASGKSRVYALCLANGGAFASLTRAPSSSEDIDWGLGQALRARLMARGFSPVALADCHNAKTDGHIFGAGSREFLEYERAIDALRAPPAAPLRLGVASDGLTEFSRAQGVGGMGLRVAVFEAGRQRHAVVLVDANNAQPAFRERVVARLRRRGLAGDLYTTDSHAVNQVTGVHNPLGAALDADALLRKIDAALDRALADLEPVSAGVASEPFETDVLGAKRMSEVVSTANSILALAKIAAPVLFVASVALAIASLALLR